MHLFLHQQKSDWCEMRFPIPDSYFILQSPKASKAIDFTHPKAELGSCQDKREKLKIYTA